MKHWQTRETGKYVINMKHCQTMTKQIEQHVINMKHFQISEIDTALYQPYEALSKQRNGQSNMSLMLSIVKPIKHTQQYVNNFRAK